MQTLCDEPMCKICRHTIYTKGLYEDLARRLLSVQICFDCDSWITHWLDRNSDNIARINGNHYIIGEPTSEIRGFGGRKVKIKFDDGRTIETDNLWHQGAIPEYFKDALDNNAVFIDRKRN